MTAALIILGGYLAGLVPLGLLARAPLQARGHPQGRLAATSARRTSGARTAAGSACRSSCSTSLKGFVPAFARACCSSRRTLSASAPARRRCSATGGRSSCASRRAGRWSRPAAASSSGSRSGWRSPPGVVWLVVFLLDPLRVGGVDRRPAIALPVLAARLGDPVSVILFGARPASRRSCSCTGRTCAACAPATETASTSGDRPVREARPRRSRSPLAIAALARARARSPPAWCGTGESAERPRPTPSPGAQVHVDRRDPARRSRIASRPVANAARRRRDRDRRLVARPGSDPDAALRPLARSQLRAGPGPARHLVRHACRRPAADLRSLDVRYQRDHGRAAGAVLVHGSRSTSSTTTGPSTTGRGRLRPGRRGLPQRSGLRRLFLQADCGTSASRATVIAGARVPPRPRRAAAPADAACVSARPRPSLRLADATSSIRRSPAACTLAAARARLRPRRLLRRTRGSWPDIQDSLWLLRRRRTQVPLTVTVNGAGRVDERRCPGVSCTAACTTQLGRRLDREPLRDACGRAQRFVAGWSGGPCAGRGDCSLTLDAPTTVTARVRPGRLRSCRSRSSARARSSAAGSRARPGAPRSSRPGTVVTLRAVPAKGWRFVRWGGPCTTSQVRCAMPVNAATTLRARLRPDEARLGPSAEADASHSRSSVCAAADLAVELARAARRRCRSARRRTSCGGSSPGSPGARRRSRCRRAPGSASSVSLSACADRVLDEARLQMSVLDDEQLVRTLQQLVDRRAHRALDDADEMLRVDRCAAVPT